MVYLAHFTFPELEQEYSFRMGLKRTCYDTVYPLAVEISGGFGKVLRLSICDCHPLALPARHEKRKDL